MVITLDLTEWEVEELSDLVVFHQDRGPTPEGWQSEGFEDFRKKVLAAIEEAERNAGQD